MKKPTPAHWPKNEDTIPLFDDSEAFCLVSQKSEDGHALLEQRIASEEAAADAARRQSQLFS